MTPKAPENLTGIPVWWDSERQKISFGGRAFKPALMFLEGDNMSVVAPDRVITQGEADEIGYRWLGKYCCDLTIRGVVCRLYFMPPNALVKRLKKTDVERIASVVGNVGRGTGVLGHLLSNAAMLGDYAAILGFVGRTLSFYQTMSDRNAGRTNVARFQAFCESGPIRSARREEARSAGTDG